ncbi:Mycothiol acetyltransferase [Marinomonas gallaica]|uniref:[Ribosomal protein bS18]-alanine N-acetyltransferase n=1 Tax=Marinomonas gallaica TaxID=1806667 RepID=A0A1C3JM44_9GAMM|nr:ribosomal protein S18-alanine N-acetyltransferase [Marinomonas gallaica]SBT16080.1 Mycothiol acetyltransferase [Marinomonas gallaica]SBT21128.1 Mycothiol acetyltransferase [Marinomonas gallaica]
MTNSYVLREATLSDAEAICALERSSDPHPWSDSLIREALQSRQSWVLACTEKPHLVGWLTASVLFDQSELELVVTDASRRRQGLGKRLVQQWLAWAREQECVEGLLEVRESNQGAIALYQQFGFEQVGSRKNYYPLAEGGHEHAVLMTCKLKEER